MPKIAYVSTKLRGTKRRVIEQANVIIEEYRAQGFNLTLRQLYYQFVSRDLIKNNQREYKRLGDTINDGRLCGMVDWNAIVDRTRNLIALPHWRRPQELVKAAAEQFRIDKWARQDYRPEVWIEKDALIGVIEDVCNELDVPYFSCRGYTSQSEMWGAAQRLNSYRRMGQRPMILHFGDHDPSGMDMTRDIRERLALFNVPTSVDRLALNFDQVEQYNPPPNFTKMSDSRSDAYIAEFGMESWELDALSPTVLAGLIRTQIEGLRDDTRWNAALEVEEAGQKQLQSITDNYTEVTDFLKDEGFV
jgi:hypothetical protein